MGKPGSLRDVMPQTAALIDDLRAAFGAEAIDEQIRRGMHGFGSFHSVENGVEVGSRLEQRGTWLTVDQLQLAEPEKKEVVRGRR